MNFQQILDFLASQPLLSLALVGIAACTVGELLRNVSPFLGGFIRGLGNLGLLAAFLLTIAQVMNVTEKADFSFAQFGEKKQVVEGKETRVPMQADGHFWINASINGVSHRFLVDTGATITAISPTAANEASVKPNPLKHSVIMRTANGSVEADMAMIDELRVGNIVARKLDAVVAPGLGQTNVIGMNFLSRLASWRVEGKTLILVPNHPQDVSAEN